MEPSNFNPEKAINSALYVASQLERSDYHKLFKILYFADGAHLSRWGRTVTEDRYVAMPYGPVPSGLYDVFKEKERTGSTDTRYGFTVSGKAVYPLRNADMDVLSESDVQALDESIEAYGAKSFDELTHLSHGSAWANTARGGLISFRDMMIERGESEEYAAYADEQMRLQYVEL